jgi:PAS domain-containing protein
MHVFERNHDRLSVAVSAVCERLDTELKNGAHGSRGTALLASRILIAGLQDKATRLVEDVLHEHERCKRAFDDAASALLITDRFGHVLGANAASGRLLARDPAALVGLSLVLLAPLEKRAALLDALARPTMHRLDILLSIEGTGTVAAHAHSLPTASGFAEFCWNVQRAGGAKPS